MKKYRILEKRGLFYPQVYRHSLRYGGLRKWMYFEDEDPFIGITNISYFTLKGAARFLDGLDAPEIIHEYKEYLQ